MRSVQYTFTLGSCLFLLVILSCSSKKVNNPNHQIQISFEVENLEKPLTCDNFSVSLIQGGNIHKGKIIDCQLELPEFKNGEDLVTIVFEYAEYRMEFLELDKEWLIPYQNMNWNFKIDFPPFDELNNDEFDQNELSMIHYLQFNPLESGDGAEIINPIYR